MSWLRVKDDEGDGARTSTNVRKILSSDSHREREEVEMAVAIGYGDLTIKHSGLG